jgi:hypothetical protein
MYIAFKHTSLHARNPDSKEEFISKLEARKAFKLQDEWEQAVEDAETDPDVLETERIYREKLARNEECNPFLILKEICKGHAEKVTDADDPLTRAMAFVLCFFLY